MTTPKKSSTKNDVNDVADPTHGGMPQDGASRAEEPETRGAGMPGAGGQAAGATRYDPNLRAPGIGEAGGNEGEVDPGVHIGDRPEPGDNPDA